MLISEEQMMPKGEGKRVLHFFFPNFLNPLGFSLEPGSNSLKGLLGACSYVGLAIGISCYGTGPLTSPAQRSCGWENVLSLD